LGCCHQPAQISHNRRCGPNSDSQSVSADFITPASSALRTNFDSARSGHFDHQLGSELSKVVFALIAVALVWMVVAIGVTKRQKI
jgi:hypothetical protein